MQLLGKLEIKSKEKIAEFLNEEHVGRIATIDEDGFPQIIPMNFVFVNDVIYMHSHTKGEKIDNVKRNPRVGFEVDRELEFLPSYFEDPHDASVADTLYISVVMKGIGIIVDERNEKTFALNELMKKYQPEGQYDPLTSDMPVLDHVAVIKVSPDSLRGKYKIGQNLKKEDRMDLAQKIFLRNSKTAKDTLEIMGFGIDEGKLVMNDEPIW